MRKNTEKLAALVVARNEELFARKCLELIHPFVDEIIFVDMESSDETRNIAAKFPKVKLYTFPYSEPVDMGAARTFSLSKSTCSWFLQVDCDEFYPPESMRKIREFIETTDAISARIAYHNLTWRPGYRQVFEHYPDRLYRRDVVSHYQGILPLDMTICKPEFCDVPNKAKGISCILEYDNEKDESFEHPRQPILKDIYFYHLARTRGYNFEYEKRKRYEKFTHPDYPDWQIEQNVKMNQWVTGLYPMEKIEVPDYIPTKNIPNPKVSIIIPCYNKEKYIGECVESCLNQSHKPYEIIVINDASTDNSESVIKNYPVTLLNQPSNTGVASARNRGLDAATGDYFILIDGDDKLHPEFTKRCLKEMKGDVQVVWTDVQMLGDWDWEHKYSGNIDELKTAQCIPSTMALCDRRVCDPYGNFKPEAIREDYEWWLNLYFNRKMNFKHIPETLCYYRRTKGSRIDYLDEPGRKERGYQQLKDWFGKFGVNPQWK